MCTSLIDYYQEKYTWDEYFYILYHRDLKTRVYEHFTTVILFNFSNRNNHWPICTQIWTVSLKYNKTWIKNSFLSSGSKANFAKFSVYSHLPLKRQTKLRGLFSKTIFQITSTGLVERFIDRYFISKTTLITDNEQIIRVLVCPVMSVHYNY